ncbi:hypothetical protein Tsubulata_045974 [Turnera subulata]|uniref:Uncharacterized protein n=1 Tax=Turnera subulata TaxID=218843 RepID=A0A9Q0JBU2_9ROSI|nr:hypothetical protein Tsubulata_051593 [Turnera subulata]KAJ4845077.1 hypothetical protein Tsubulata_045974 [Turnera subulata]
MIACVMKFVVSILLRWLMKGRQSAADSICPDDGVSCQDVLLNKDLFVRTMGYPVRMSCLNKIYCFDCLDACMERDNPYRMIIETVYFGRGIRNTKASEGEQRVIRYVNIKAWRGYFARFGMVETGLSSSSLYQAKLILQKFPCGSFCNLDNDGQCLIIGWRGTPLHSLSAWKIS